MGDKYGHLVKSDVIIYITQDYSMFKELPGNREVTKAATDVILGLVKDHNRLDYNPIEVNEDFQVIDGQHRLEVAKYLNMPISFTIYKEKAGLKLTTIVNSRKNSKSWTDKDHLNSNCDLANPNYLKLRVFLQKYPKITISNARFLFNGRTDVGNRDEFEDGKFKANNYNDAVYIAELIDSFKYIHGKKVYNVHFIRALYWLNDWGIKIDWNRMRFKCESKQVPMKSWKDDHNMIIDDLQKWYNIGLRKNKLLFRLTNEVI